MKIKWLLLCGILFFLSFHVYSTTTIQNLRVEYLKNPIGIDAPNPQFSWEMESDETGQCQTAYQIALFDGDRTKEVWNSGKINSNISVGIKYAGSALSPSTRYFWKVDVWDKNGTKISSYEEAFFETGLMQSGWSGAHWLKIKEKSESTEPVSFTLACDITVIDQNAGVIFGAKDANNMYMWAINTYQVSHPILRRHIFIDGNATAIADIPLPAQFTTEQILNHERRLKIDVVDNVIYTYLDGVLVDTYNSPALQNGFIGFRVYTGDNGTHEHAYVDNIEYKYSENGIPKTFTENFENGSNDFEEANTIMVNGNTKMDLMANGNADFRVLQNEVQGIPMFRNEFVIAKPIKSARIYASALGIYDMFINGRRVGTPQSDGNIVYDELKPGWTDYRKTVFYSTYDITDLLKSGQNAIGAEVSSGWFTGRIAHNEYGVHPLAFIAKILVAYSDGTTETFVTNTSNWKATTNSPIRMADIYDGENYDARKESNWTTSDFDDSDWLETDVNNYFTGDMLAFIGQPVRVRTSLEQKPKSIVIYNGINPDASTYGQINIVRMFAASQPFSLQKGETAIIDFGQNFAGWIKFKVKGSSGTKVRARFAEMLNDSGESGRGNDNAKGTLYLKNLRSAKATLNYILKGDAMGEIFNPSMTFFGFRYCEITATGNTDFEYVNGEVVGTANEENSSFTTSNEMVNRLYSNIIWGQRSNFLSVPTDCPQRDERLGWMGDTQIFSRAAAYNADVVSFFNKWAKDVLDSQQPDGTYPSVVPYNWGVGSGRTAWAEAGIIVPWNMYLMYGNKEVLNSNYASMEKFMDWMATQQFDGYLYNGGNTQYGDWLAYEETNPRFISVCYYAYVAQLMTKISAALSQSANDFYAQKAAKYQTLYNNIKSEFQSRYVNSRNGFLSVDTQTAYLLALQNDLFPNAEKTQNAVNHLVEKIRNNGNKLSTGFVGTGILNQTLSKFGASDVAYNLLLQRNNPSWLYSVDQGATTIWERWNSYTIASGFGDPSMNSFNHYSYGAVSEWKFRYMAGIEADEKNPGFKHFFLQPTPDLRDVPENERITMVDASFGSYYGKIKIKWERLADGNYRYVLTVPANTTATLYLPRYNDTIKVYQNGVAAEKVEGVINFTTETKRFVLELESGSYVFDNKSSNASGVKTVKKNFKLNVYPNPANNRLIVDNTELSIKSVEIINLSGKEIMNCQLAEGKYVEISKLPIGVYFLKIKTDDGIQSVKFTKR